MKHFIITLLILLSLVSCNIGNKSRIKVLSTNEKADVVNTLYDVGDTVIVRYDYGEYVIDSRWMSNPHDTLIYSSLQNKTYATIYKRAVILD